MSRFWCFSLWYITFNSSKHQSIVLERVAYHEELDFCLFFKKKKHHLLTFILTEITVAWFRRILNQLPTRFFEMQWHYVSRNVLFI